MANINSSIGALLFVTAFTKPTSTHMHLVVQFWGNMEQQARFNKCYDFTACEITDDFLLCCTFSYKMHQM